MRFELTKRDAIILGIFILFLIACCYAYVRHATAPRTSDQPTEGVATAEQPNPDAHAEASSANVDIDSLLKRRSAAVQRYAAIWERNVFKPVASVLAEDARNRQAAVNVTAPLQPLPPPMGIQARPQSFQPSENIKGAMAHRPPEKPRDIAYTAFVLMNGEPVALIENLTTKEGFYVREGDYVFGMRVVRVAPDAIELERDGHSFYYALGENKEKRELMARSVSLQRAPSTSTSSQQQSTMQSQQAAQSGQVEQGQQIGSQPSSSQPTFRGRSEFFEQMMRRMRERYGGEIPPDVMERMRRFRRRFEEGG